MWVVPEFLKPTLSQMPTHLPANANVPNAVTAPAPAAERPAKQPAAALKAQLAMRKLR